MGLVKHATDKFRSAGRSRYDNYPWSMHGSSRHALAELFGANGYNRGAEIGVKRGSYSRVLCELNPKLLLFCVDPWVAYGCARVISQEVQDEHYCQACKHLEKCNVEIIRKPSMDALADFGDESLDFVFIDGDHQFDAVVQDIIHWSRKVKSGGCVAVHDYYAFYLAGVVQAVDAYVHCHNIRPWFVTRDRNPTAYWEKP